MSQEKDKGTRKQRTPSTPSADSLADVPTGKDVSKEPNEQDDRKREREGAR